jgi:hypothetical protein
MMRNWLPFIINKMISRSIHTLSKHLCRDWQRDANLLQNISYLLQVVYFSRTIENWQLHYRIFTTIICVQLQSNCHIWAIKFKIIVNIWLHMKKIKVNKTSKRKNKFYFHFQLHIILSRHMIINLHCGTFQQTPHNI